MTTEINTTQLARQAEAILAQVQQSHGHIRIKRDGRPVAVLMDNELFERLWHGQTHAHAVDKAPGRSVQMDRAHAISAIKQWPQRIVGAPMTLDEIISARDEGRK